VPVKVVSERLGHAQISLTLDIYAHVLPSMDRQASEVFAAALEEPGARTTASDLPVNGLVCRRCGEPVDLPEGGKP
jgi:hypothetical protein